MKDPVRARGAAPEVPELERIAYESAVRALDKQERVVEELRARTGILVAASSLAASLLGSRALDVLHPLVLVFLALGAFVVSLGAGLAVLVPREGFVFALNGPEVYERLFDFRDDPGEVHRRLAYDLQRFWDGNEERLRGIRTAFRVAAYALGIEILALTLVVSGTV